MRSLLTLLFSVVAFAGSVSTGSYNNQRTGANTAETRVTQANASTLKLLGTFTVDGDILAQPLVIETNAVAGVRNILIVATLANTLYAFNADAPGTSALWSFNAGTTVQHSDADLYNTEIGCVATPVVDTSAAVVYVLCEDATNRWRLYARNLADGTQFHAPVTISGTSGGSTFDATIHLSRVALTLSGGKIFIAFGSYFDAGSYRGWVFAYNSTTLAQTAAWAAVTSGGSAAGIWMSGGGISVDSSGNLYLITGNGTCNSGANSEYGEAIVKLSSALAVLDWMSPTNCATLNSGDTDLGASRAVLIGDTPVMGGGKDGRWWVLSTASLGHSSDAGLNFTAANGVFNSVAYGNSSLFLGVALGSTTRKVYRRDWNGSTFSGVTATSATSYAFPGPMISYSSNGATAATDLIWMTTCSSSADSTRVAGTLRVLRADTLAELYNSDTVGGDALGTYAKFVAPTVVNGKAYVGTFSSKVQVYGLPYSGKMTLGPVTSAGPKSVK